MAVKKFSMDEVRPRAQRDRAETEAHAQDALSVDGRHRRRMGRTKQILIRTTEARGEQLHELAERLSEGHEAKVSYSETFEQALDALEREIKTKGTKQ